MSEEFNQENRVTFLKDRSSRRRARSRNKLSENTLAMQERYVKDGHFPISEIAFLMANDAFEDLTSIGEKHGLTSKEYQEAFKRTNDAVKTALPYFATPCKPQEDVDGDITDEVVENALMTLINKNKK